MGLGVRAFWPLAFKPLFYYSINILTPALTIKSYRKLMEGSRERPCWNIQLGSKLITVINKCDWCTSLMHVHSHLFLFIVSSILLERKKSYLVFFSKEINLLPTFQLWSTFKTATVSEINLNTCLNSLPRKKKWGCHFRQTDFKFQVKAIFRLKSRKFVRLF